MRTWGRDGLLERQGDPDTRFERDASDVRERDFIGGVNVLISGSHVKCQANCVRKTYTGGLVPSRHQVLTNMQLWW